MTDPIADLLTRIRNALAVNKKTVDIPHSKLKEAIVSTMVKEGYLANFSLKDSQTPQKTIEVTLKYNHKQPAISNLNRVSKPGRRVYVKASNIKPVLSGYGIKIISTNQGVMTGKQARKQQIGGEVLCQLW